jgi:flagellar basal-body rod protein FlgG
VTRQTEKPNKAESHMSFEYTVNQSDKNPYYLGLRDASHASVMRQRHLAVISNNLANSNTPGFKADRMIFNDLMERKIKTDHGQGSMNHTANDLDLAISGEGYFQIGTREGIRLTRDGSFRMRGDGTVVNPMGFPVLGAGGAPIILNPEGEKVFIDPSGAVFQGEEEVGRLSIVTVDDPDSLEKAGHNLFAAKGGQAPQTLPSQDYSLSQGYLETSNVQVVQEMVGMIEAFRSFESYQKAIQAQSEMDKQATTQVGRAA